MCRKAAVWLLSFVVGLSVVVSGCAGDEPHEFAEDPALGALSVTAVNGTSKVTLCNLPRYTRQTTVRLCGYTTSGSDASAIAAAWFDIDGGTVIPVVPGNGGFVDTSTSLSEGEHIVRLFARSAAGNLTFEEKKVTVDLTAPLLQVLAPTSADVMTSTVVHVTSSVVDATPVRVQTQWVASSTVDSGVGTVTHTVDLVNRGFNTLLVRAIDAAGWVTEVRVRLYFCPASDEVCASSAHWAPVIVSAAQSADSVPASGGVTFRVDASDPQGSPLSFSWEANTGTLGNPTSGASSEVVWTAPSCASANVAPSITVTVSNGLGLSVKKTFSVTATLDGCSSVTTCKTLLEATPGAPSGVYTIDPDGAGPGAPFPAFCDMVTADGGWTVLEKNPYGNPILQAFYSDAPVNEGSPALNRHRLSKHKMAAVLANSTDMRIDCRGRDYLLTAATNLFAGNGNGQPNCWNVAKILYKEASLNGRFVANKAMCTWLDGRAEGCIGWTVDEWHQTTYCGLPNNQWGVAISTFSSDVFSVDPATVDRLGHECHAAGAVRWACPGYVDSRVMLPT